MEDEHYFDERSTKTGLVLRGRAVEAGHPVASALRKLIEDIR